MTTRKDLLSFFEKMEAERTELLGGLKNHSEETLTKKPAADAWSVTEVILHLSKAEEGALKYMQVKLKHGGHRKASFAASLKQRFLNLAITLPFKYKAPNVIKLDEGSTSFGEAVENWNAIRLELKSEYQSVEESLIDHELFKHPVAGKLSIMQSVKFMRQHVLRHSGQIERTLQKVSA
jgi:uncharacterized damage-inducible protein DinB